VIFENIYLVFIPISWHTTPKILVIFKMIRVSLYTNALDDGWKPLGL
jgi:hypothetical protein